MNQFRPRSKSKKTSARRQNGWLTTAANWLTLRLGLEKRLTATTLAKMLWVGVLAFVYIYFQHNFDRLIRKTENAEKTVEERRSVYIYHKAKYLYSSKQSEIEKKLQGRGFTNQEPPIKISTTTH